MIRRVLVNQVVNLIRQVACRRLFLQAPARDLELLTL
jgi:hypothetical protein